VPGTGIEPVRPRGDTCFEAPPGMTPRIAEWRYVAPRAAESRLGSGKASGGRGEHHRRHPLCRVLLHRRDRVRVDVQRNLDVRVAEPFSDHLRVHPRRQGKRREGVPQITANANPSQGSSSPTAISSRAAAARTCSASTRPRKKTRPGHGRKSSRHSTAPVQERRVPTATVRWQMGEEN
jgi:hypothetical protein